MTPEQVAQRYQYRTGYRLADYAEVGLPVYLLTVRALTLAHKKIPPIEEFVLGQSTQGYKVRPSFGLSWVTGKNRKWDTCRSRAERVSEPCGCAR